LTLIGKPDCHLCDDAREAIAAVLTELDAGDSVTLEELSIVDDAVLNARYWDEIPVLMIDGAVHTIWRVDHERLRVALLAAQTTAQES
jgi:hypothetical protein